LEQVGTCRTIIFDKTGTLTYGQAQLTEQRVSPGWEADEVMGLVASVERYSKHPLAQSILRSADEMGIALKEAASVSEPPGKGLHGVVDGREVFITSRREARTLDPNAESLLPEQGGGLECAVLVDGRYAALYRFRDAPRKEGAAFVNHLGKHGLDRVLLVSGDRESEVRYLADQVGIQEIHAGQSPEQKVAIVKRENAAAKTIFVGDGINDAPAMLVATVGVAFGQASDVTTEAAGAVVMDSSLGKVDEFFHIGAHMRRIILQSAIGGIALSIGAMGFAFAGVLSPVFGALVQEIIDVIAVTNALRAGVRPRSLTDYA
ncbi:MAG: HAD-IC family P-type ATPase, partial [Bdellovibrionales bacterium]|nr:HAD-IC family P-type ATPase [Bdellovibrionales bacterium]